MIDAENAFPRMFCPECGRRLIAAKQKTGSQRVVIIAALLVTLIFGVAFGSALGPPIRTMTATLVITTTQAQVTATREATTSAGTSTSAEAWNLVWEYKADYVIKAVSISSDGNYIAAVGDNWQGYRNDVRHLLARDGRMLWTKDTSELLGSWMNDVSVSRNAAYIVVGSEDRIYLLRGDGTVVWERGYRDYDHLEGTNYVSVSDDGEQIAGS